ncbi:protein singed wings 2 isoform X2 [Cryptotermes secundus]|uniref:protein singed wings 2 isoform X2 n=1 Tax=Cryptotermes secundus TaxID=105785 RepID=UPI000CD7DC1F|nr:protein singed wings 2 isoform X2 [Cryptotermes secundus]
MANQYSPADKVPNTKCWILILGWTVVIVTSCPPDTKCKRYILDASKNLRVACSGGLHGKFLTGVRRQVRELTLCHWPNSSFDPQIIQFRFPELRNLTLRDSDVSQLKEFGGELKELQELNVSGLRLDSVVDSTFSRLKKLRVLDLRGNNLKQLGHSVLASPPALREVFLSGNPWDCSNDLMWLVDEGRNESMARRVVDRDKMICNNETYPKKPVLPIMGMLKTLQAECPTVPPANCTCHMDYVAPDPDGVTLRPVTTINCSYRGLVSLPERLPSVTTTLLVKGNQISSLKPLVSNPHYRDVLDVFLDDNQIHSIESLEGADWLLNFRVLSLRNNQLTQVLTYALDNALQRNRNAAIVYLGNNPWICDCLFTPTFQDFIIKYRKLVKDIDDVRCASVHGDENSLTQIQALSRSTVCREPSEYLIQPLDLLNGILASLIVLVVGKLIYDYWSFKKTGKLPWLVAKMP